MQELKTDAGTIQCEDIRNGIPINPTVYPLPMDAHKLTEEEINLWRRRPYILSEGNQWKLFYFNQFGYKIDIWGTFEKLENAICEVLTDRKPPETSVGIDDLDF
jgi:hypothetical protein